MKKRNPMAREVAKPQYRPRIKPNKRRKIEADRDLKEGQGDVEHIAGGREALK